MANVRVRLRRSGRRKPSPEISREIAGLGRAASVLAQVSFRKIVGINTARSSTSPPRVATIVDTARSDYRDSADDVRSHLDVPVAELASLALPFVRLRLSDEEVIRRLADHFQLGRRLREGARTRFEMALAVAQQHQT
jgi:hypothetical protein